MKRSMKLIAITAMSTGLAAICGCSPNMGGAGGYGSTSSEQNVGSRSSNGTYGGTSDETGRVGGTTGAGSAPATPYRNTAPSGNGGGVTGGGGGSGAMIGPQNPQ